MVHLCKKVGARLMFRVKYLLRITSMILFLVVLSACAFDKEAKIQEEIAVLDKQAYQNYQQRNITGTIEAYEKVLELNADDSRALKRIPELKNEIKAIEGAKKFRDELYSIRKERLRSGIDVRATDMKYIIEDIRVLTGEFESLKVNFNSDISTYINDVKDSLNYSFLKSDIETDLYDEAELDDALSAIDAEFGLVSAMSTATIRNSLNDNIDKILDVELPDLNYE